MKRIKNILAWSLCLIMALAPVSTYAEPSGGADRPEAYDAVDAVDAIDAVDAETVIPDSAENDGYVTGEELSPEETAEDTPDYVEGEAVVLYHTGESDGDTGAGEDSADEAFGATNRRTVINSSMPADPLTSMGFSVEQVWDLTLDEDDLQDSSAGDYAADSISPQFFSYAAPGLYGDSSEGMSGTVPSSEETSGGISDEIRDEISDEPSGEEPAEDTDLRVALVRKDGDSTEDLIKNLEDLDMVEAACPNYLYEPDDLGSEADTVSADRTEATGSSVSDDSTEISENTIPEDDGETTEDGADETGDDEADSVPSVISVNSTSFPQDLTQPVYTSAYLNDPLHSAQGYSLSEEAGIDLEKALEKEAPISHTGKKDNVIAIIDSGVDWNHPDLSDNMWTDTGNVFGFGTDCHGVNTIKNTGDPAPYENGKSNTHGTHVAGCAAAVNGNGTGTASPAGNGHTKIMAFNAFNEKGSIPLSSAVAAYEYIIKAKKAGINVVAVNNSWGSSSGTGRYNVPFSYVVAQAGKAGVLTFGSCGNNNADVVSYYQKINNENPYYVVVSATDQNNDIAGFSSYSEYYSDLAVPGAAILSTVPSDMAVTYNPILSAAAGVPQEVYISTLDQWEEASAEVRYYYVSNGTHDVTDRIVSFNAVSLSRDGDNKPVFTINKEEYRDFARDYLGSAFNEANMKTYLKNLRIKISFRIDNPMTASEDPSEYLICPDAEYDYGPGEGDACLRVYAAVTELKTADGINIRGSGTPQSGYGAASHTYSCSSPDSNGGDSLSLNAVVTLSCGENTSYRSDGIRWKSNGDAIKIRLEGFAIGKKESSKYAPYAHKSGTSMATPVAAGMAAELAYIYQTESALELRGRVVGGTVPLSDRIYNYNGTTHIYSDMTASGGRGTFSAMLQDAVSGYNANTWSLASEGGNVLTLYGYALRGASVSVDGIGVPVTESDDHHVSFRVHSGVMDGKQHRFTVTDSESGRTYKAEYIVPVSVPVSVNAVSKLPTEDESGYAQLISTPFGLCYGSGYGDYFHIKTGKVDDDAHWVALDTPGWPLSERKISDSSFHIVYQYGEGGIYAFCADVSKADGSKAGLYVSRLDMTESTEPAEWCWTDYRELVTFKESGVSSLAAAAYGGRIYASADAGSNYLVSLAPDLSNMSSDEMDDISAYGFQRLEDYGLCQYVNESGTIYLYDVREDASRVRIIDIKPYNNAALRSIMTSVRGAEVAGGYIYGGYNQLGDGEFYYLDTRGGHANITGAGVSAGYGVTLGDLVSYEGELLAPAVSTVDEVSRNSVYRIPTELFTDNNISSSEISNTVRVSAHAGEGGRVEIVYLGRTVSGNTEVKGAGEDRFILRAIPDEGWYVDRWTRTGDDDWSDRNASLVMQGWQCIGEGEDPAEFVAHFRTNMRLDHTVTVKFGEYEETIIVKSGETVPLKEIEGHDDFKAFLASITEEGYTFSGWYLGESLYDISTPVRSDITLLAGERTGTTSGNSGSGMDAYKNLVNGKTYYMAKGQKYTFGVGNKGRWTTSDSIRLSINRKTGAVKAKKATVSATGREYVTIRNEADGTSYSICIYDPMLLDSSEKAVTGTRKMVVGDTASFSLKDRLSRAYMGDAVWLSTNTSVAIVTGGQVRAVGKGSAKIVAYSLGKAYSMKISVSDTRTYKRAYLDGTLETRIVLNPLNKVTLKNNKQTGFDPRYAVWYDDMEGQLRPVYNAKGTKTTGYTDGIVTISHKGVITAVGPGTVDLLGVDRDGTQKIIHMTVIPPDPDYVSRKNLRKGRTATIKIPKVSTSKAEWETEDEAAVRLVKKGKIKALSEGSTLVHCRYLGFDFMTLVCVEDPAIDTTDGRMGRIGTRQRYTLTLKQGEVYRINTEGVSRSVLYRSSRPSALFIDERGILYARRPGTVTVTGKINGVTMKIKVVIRQDD